MRKLTCRHRPLPAGLSRRIKRDILLKPLVEHNLHHAYRDTTWSSIERVTKAHAHIDDDPHAGGAVLTEGPDPERAERVVILLHGRGASAKGMLRLFGEVGVEKTAALAPQASQSSWYPRSFLAPIPENQPYLDSAILRLRLLVEGLLDRGVRDNQIALLGFSQGACLALEFAARFPRRYGALIGLTGGLIGPLSEPREYFGSLRETPVFLGTSDPDPHVPLARVLETKRVLEHMGARVELRVYRGMPHTINADEVDACRGLMRQIHKEEAKIYE